MELAAYIHWNTAALTVLNVLQIVLFDLWAHYTIHLSLSDQKVRHWQTCSQPLLCTLVVICKSIGQKSLNYFQTLKYLPHPSSLCLFFLKVMLSSPCQEKSVHQSFLNKNWALPLPLSLTPFLSMPSAAVSSNLPHFPLLILPFNRFSLLQSLSQNQH